jgi:NAD(P)-dependent dehydrogenase (short-subunit alcohol dehydrogenase family)
MRGLAGKVAIVPGGCTLIGRAIVDAFVAAGASVMVADIAEGGGFAPGVAFQTCDLRDDAQIAAFWRIPRRWCRPPGTVSAGSTFW